MIVHVVGARPNFMKAAPVIAALARAGDRSQMLVHTGQHYDHRLSDVFFRDLDLPEPDRYLGVGSGSHSGQTARVMLGFEEVVEEVRPGAVVVYGDVNSTLACALVAAQARIPLAHVEAGLRSFDPSMPEELNRVVTDRVASRHYIHSPEAERYLAAEGCPRQSVVFAGNTMIDTLDRYREQAEDQAPWRRFGAGRGDYALVTLHRPGLVDAPGSLGGVMAALQELADGWRPLIFPVHPRTRRVLDLLGFVPGERLVLCEPMGYLEFLGLELGAAACITDSGGVQEESAALGVRCFTLRRNTERPVTLECGNRLLGDEPGAIAAIPRLCEEPLAWRRPRGWDGRAGERVAADLRALVGVPALQGSLG